MVSRKVFHEVSINFTKHFDIRGEYSSLFEKYTVNLRKTIDSLFIA